MSASPFAWDWRAETEPPEPQAAVALGEAARRLHQRLSRLDAAMLERLQAVAAPSLLVVIAESDDLPWVEGVEYARRCPEAPSLWLPLHWRPEPPADLLLAALSRNDPVQPLLLWREPAMVLPLGGQLPLSPELLAQIATRWRAA